MIWERPAAAVLDGAMCAMMYAVQRRHRLGAESRAAFANYIAKHESLTRDVFYFSAPPVSPSLPPPNTPTKFLWRSPLLTAFPENNVAGGYFFPCAAGWSAPTVLFLHALMSASDRGYRRWAARFNARGWNACFVHLPYHYSRTPQGHLNGELAVTADLVRTGEGLRQGVIELRQIMAQLRAWGCQEFGLWASSYGGWIGALLASVERDFRFIALMQPIVDVDHAIWRSLAGLALRRQLPRRGIEPALIARHFRLISPLHGEPLCDPARILLGAGAYDHIAPAEAVERLHLRWPESEFLKVSQGHFGYRLMRTIWSRLVERGEI